MDIKKIEQMGMEQGFSHVVLLDCDTIEKIVEEMMTTTKSERTTRVIDFDQDASMEQKKREGYF